jgi:hypothetical protein
VILLRFLRNYRLCRKSVCEVQELEADLIGFIRAREIYHQWEARAIIPGSDRHFSFGLPESDEPISIERNPTTCVLS